jgi:hypothetical protein
MVTHVELNKYVEFLQLWQFGDVFIQDIQVLEQLIQTFDSGKLNFPVGQLVLQIYY